VTQDNLNPPGAEPDEPRDQPAEGKEVEEFFQRLPGNFRWPKPNAEAVAAAVEAIHRMLAAAALPAQDAEVRCLRALAFVSGAESPPRLSQAMPLLHLDPVPGNITFTTTTIILSPALPSPAMEPQPMRPLPSPSLRFLAVALPVLRVLLPAAVLKPALARLFRTGPRPATPGTLTT
jgi:hypothetical protein